ncbi:MAG: zf-HC2 domain-containing protein [Candidatus Aminicenantes bacterium]|nr:zf-HC2 domain-containing protein [Candidatus Aminicenantes bacterium]
MKCNKFRENIVLDLYGELDDKQKAELELHITVCTECAEDQLYSKAVFQALEDLETEDIPEPTWDSSWGKINLAIQDKPAPRSLFGLSPKWAYAAAGVSLVFALGIFTGRFWLPQTQKQKGLISADLSQEYIQSALAQHFENIKPVMVEMANYTAKENGNGTVLVDRETLKNLIIQNILLKSLISGKDPTAVQILEDVDLVLRELANIDEGDSETKSMIKELIDDREILVNMNILQKI